MAEGWTRNCWWSYKRNEKESHDALEEAKRIEEATERARLIAVLSSPAKPYDPEADPSVKEALDIIKIANDAMDKAVDKLLNEAADKVLKEDWSFVFSIV